MGQYIFISSTLLLAMLAVYSMRPRSVFALFGPRTARGYTPPIIRPKEPKSAALMGSSTRNFGQPNIDARATILIQLAIFAMGKFNRKTNIVLEKQIGLPKAHKKNIQSAILRELNAPPAKLSSIINPAHRLAQGNYDVMQRLFSDLCTVARQSENVDAGTLMRLRKIGEALELPQDVTAALLP